MGLKFCLLNGFITRGWEISMLPPPCCQGGGGYAMYGARSNDDMDLCRV